MNWLVAPNGFCRAKWVSGRIEFVNALWRGCNVVLLRSTVREPGSAGTFSQDCSAPARLFLTTPGSCLMVWAGSYLTWSTQAVHAVFYGPTASKYRFPPLLLLVSAALWPCLGTSGQCVLEHHYHVLPWMERLNILWALDFFAGRVEMEHSLRMLS